MFLFFSIASLISFSEFPYANPISINSLFLDAQYSIINSISEEYGSQSIVLSLDFIQIEDRNYYLYDYRKKEKSNIIKIKIYSNFFLLRYIHINIYCS